MHRTKFKNWNSGYLNNQLNEVDVAKSWIERFESFIVGFSILHHVKLRLLELSYKFEYQHLWGDGSGYWFTLFKSGWKKFLFWLYLKLKKVRVGIVM